MLRVVRKIPLAPGLLGFILRLRAYARFALRYNRFKKMNQGSERFELSWKNRMVCLGEDSAGSGFDPHYLYHPAWAARILAQTRPARHTDISSSLRFAAVVSAFVPLDHYDFRPANIKLSGLSCGRADLLGLPFADRSVRSLSCMHVVEHIGLGRYGDALDPNADLKAMSELGRVLAPGGNLLFAVPVSGRPRIMFNGQRIYSRTQIVEAFQELELVEFSLIPDRAAEQGMIFDAPPGMTEAQEYGCGCFWFKRREK